MGLWSLLNRPLPMAAARDALVQPVVRGLKAGWRLASTPVKIFGWKASATSLLAWNVVWSVAYLGGLGGYGFWALRTNDHDERLRSLELLEERLAPVWQQISDRYYAQLPAPTMALPQGDPQPTLAKLLASPLVRRAYYLAPDMVLHVRERRYDYDTRQSHEYAYQVALATWRPNLDLLLSTAGPYSKAARLERMLQRTQDDFVEGVLRRGLPGDEHAHAAFEPTHDVRYAFYVKGQRNHGVLGYATGENLAAWHEAERVVHDSELDDIVTPQDFWGPARRTTFKPTVNLPVELQALHLAPTEEGLAWADAQNNRRDLPVLALLLALFLARMACASQDLRKLLNERAIAVSQSDFVSAVSHEMRTPLTTIKLYAEMLAQDVVTEPARRTHYLETIAAESERLGRLIENVLDYARISGRRKAYRFEPVDLREVLSEALSAVNGPLAQAGLAVELHAPVALVAPVDRDALVQAMINLLANAAKYAAAGQRVVVAALPEEGGLALSVQDFGPGIAPEEQAKVFKPFYRVGSELTRTTTGSGLGLALVAETAKAHGGRVELESVPGQGSAFRLVLPLPAP